MVFTAENPEDILINRISGLLPGISVEDISELPEAKNIDSFSLELKEKAWWCYNFVSRGKKNNIRKGIFLQSYVHAWSLFYLSGAYVKAGLNCPPRISCRIPPIVWLYHFPEYPLLLNYFKDRNVGIIAKRAAPWMGDTRIFLVDDYSVAKRIYSFLQEGGSVFGMLDYAYEHTHNSFVEFLGIPSRTPLGLFKIATELSLDTGLLFFEPVKKQVKIIQYSPSEFNSVLDFAANVSDDLSKIIMKNASRWLLWPNLNHRWNLDYR